MNPIYKFVINKDSSRNLLNPAQVTTEAGGRRSAYIPVTLGKNYAIRNVRGEAVSARWEFYTGTYNLAYTSGGTETGDIVSGIAYVRVYFPERYSVDDWGVFETSVKRFEYFEGRVFPIFKDDLSKDYELQSNERFFRAKLSGKLTFEGPDYDWIIAQTFDFEFLLTLYISHDAGNTWSEYWRGTFWKTDCEFDRDAETVEVTPTVADQYTAVLAGIDKEYNLIDLLPEIVPVRVDKRPMIQVYVPGQTVIGCFLSGMWWEQECESVTNEVQLTTKYRFAKNNSVRICDVSGQMTPQLPELFTLSNPGLSSLGSMTDGTYTISIQRTGNQENLYNLWQISRNSDGTVLWAASQYGTNEPEIPYSITLQPVSGSGATGNVVLDFRDVAVYARYVLDVEKLGNLNTYQIPTDDLVPDNRNYRRVIGYSGNNIYFSTRLSTTPTKWGIYQPGQYYMPPYMLGNSEFFPVSRGAWGRVSIWFLFNLVDTLAEKQARAEFILRDAYPLSSVISVLLAQIAPDVTHQPTEEFSQFLYGTPYVNPEKQTLFITPKSNVISANYDQPAQKAPITLRNVLDMLRDCFRCYWFVDEQNRFRIEHVRYFMNGGAYTGTPEIGENLTVQTVPASGKPWAFARDRYNFDKPDTASRYQFRWMDAVTELFEGAPIDIVSKYVDPENIENIDVSKFTSDIDYILLNPADISKDGFVLLAGEFLEIISGQSSSTSVTASSPYILPVSGLVSDDTINLSVLVTPSASNIMEIHFLDSSNNVLSRIAAISISTAQQYTFDSVPVPAGAEKIRFRVLSFTGSVSVRVLSLNRGYKLPYVDFFRNGASHILQNAYVAFVYLQRYYLYDLPAPIYKIDGTQYYANGVKKLKTQTLTFPALYDPDLYKYVRTNLGNGIIQKMSVNLSSRNVNITLKHDTQ